MASGLDDIPGVLGPIEDPFERERRRLYADPMVNIPLAKPKTQFNLIPSLTKIVYYSVDYPIDQMYRFFNAIKTIKPQRYYHQKFNRVPNIWECHTDDIICVYEAESQFRRDRKVDQEIIKVVQQRLKICRQREGLHAKIACKELYELEEKVKAAWQIKYGDLGINCNAIRTLQKQKNRLIEDRYLARKNTNNTSASE